MFFLEHRGKIIGILIFPLVLSLLWACNQEDKKSDFNLGFEVLNKNSAKPADWIFFGNEGYTFNIDSTEKIKGNYSLSIKRNSDFGKFGACAMVIPSPMEGDTLTLSGFVKSENVEGSAGLWMRVDDSINQVLAFDNMRDRPITGTRAWQKYFIKLPYSSSRAERVIVGGLLHGTGEIWIDDLHLSIDGKSISTVKLKDSIVTPQEVKDSDEVEASGFLNVELTPDKVNELANLGMLWGFLKYYHPAVINGKVNWDEELFRILPDIMISANPNQAYQLMEKWVDGLGTVPVCRNCSNSLENKIKIHPQLGDLLKANNLPKSLIRKIEFIYNNYSMPRNDYYVSLNRLGNPIFKNEIKYNSTPYPTAAIRLLALYRYWNMIQYFYPYRYLIKDWDQVLSESIKSFIKATDKYDYLNACLKLIAKIRDTHARINGNNATLDTLKGVRMTPFKAEFVENKLVVVGYYMDISAIKNKIHIGDIIEKINGITVDSLIRRYLPLTSASNHARQLFELSSSNGFLLRGNKQTVDVVVKRKGVEKNLAFQTIPFYEADNIDEIDSSLHQKGYQLLNAHIGYIYPAKLKTGDLDSIKSLFAMTKGIVIDMRCYPSIFMPFTFGSWLKKNYTPFAQYTSCSLIKPGAVVDRKIVSNGGSFIPNSGNGFYYGLSNSAASNKKVDHYKGKLVIIVNSETLSQAEYTTMSLGSVPGAKVIGSVSAGADGNISSIELPGGVLTWISGIGIYYPDGSPTQRVGVKIDVAVKTTVKDIMEKRDPFLRKAIEIVDQN